MSRMGRVLGRLVAAVGMLAAMQMAAVAAGYQVNDRVRVFVSGTWYDATVVSLGTGDYAGDYYVKFDVGGQQYAEPQNVEPLTEEAAPPPPAPSYQLNDRVRVSVSGIWYDGTVIGFGTGEFEGDYYIKFDAGGEQYALPRNVEPLTSSAEPAAPAAAGLTAGLYICVGFDGGTYRWSLALGSNGVYQQQKPDTAAGYYSVAADVISFTSGNYADNGWFGRIVTENGRTIVVLRSLANERQGARVNEYENIYCHLG